MQILQPINDHQQPVKITPEYAFSDAPKTRCIYHPQHIQHFCKEPSCLMPLCQECIQVHPHQHSRYIDSIESTLTQVYRGFAKRANEIATHQRGDILQIRSDLHKLIDTIIDDVLHKADQNYQQNLVTEWRNIIKKLEKLKDPNTCLKEIILYFAEPDQGYYDPQLCYQGRPVQVNYEALEQARFHLHHLFMVSMEDGEYFFRPGEKTGDNPIRRVSRIVYDTTLPQQIDYQPYNYTPQKKLEYSQPIVMPPQQILYQQPQQLIQQPQIIQQQIQQPQIIQQPPIVQVVPQAQPTQVLVQQPQQQIIVPQPQQIFISKAEQPQQQPLVYYQESPIKIQKTEYPKPVQQQIHQQQPPPIIQYVQPVIRTPQTVPSVYAVSSVKPFIPQSSGEYSHPYPLN